MQRLASRILIVVAVFVVVITGILIARTRGTRVESVDGNPTNADLAIKALQLEEDEGRPVGLTEPIEKSVEEQRSLSPFESGHAPEAGGPSRAKKSLGAPTNRTRASGFIPSLSTSGVPE